MDELQDKYKYDMILVRDILSELNIDLWLSENTVKWRVHVQNIYSPNEIWLKQSLQWEEIF